MAAATEAAATPLKEQHPVTATHQNEINQKFNEKGKVREKVKTHFGNNKIQKFKFLIHLSVSQHRIKFCPNFVF